MTLTILNPPVPLNHGVGQSCLEVWRATPHARHGWIKAGYPARDAKALLQALDLNQAGVFRALNLSVATVNKKAKAGERLTTDESERVLGVAKLIGQLEAIVEESGDPVGFDAAAWMSRWLSEPLPALGGVKPIDLLDTMEGQALVSRSLAQMQSGAFA
ncbi:antitoxin Xre/MbcA/ParS toxin-binding domain-containing protein [Phenylobacterium aquaticum]|uniref:type II RES/Xre toxin-antitoxin system antitoxin n=1 Tax=Phenylobacterium aquaticum TaxID=1763816 RepID=UPI001F5D2EFE|nr:antitoxin Xre/MbcA/ParS toxin-binding domain-containing protein [Phenylobacterium aquaticum]MCI3132305.1 DUF2384 domain-containing protein [Phenylobacterium aquaticum]